jgi:hypothetical protein
MFLIHGNPVDNSYTKDLNPSGQFNPKRYGNGSYGALAAKRLAHSESDLPLSIRYSQQAAKNSFRPTNMTADQKFNLIAFTHELMEAVAGGPVLKGLNGKQAARFVTALLDFAPPAHQIYQPPKKGPQGPTLESVSQELLEASLGGIDQNEDGHYSLSELATFVHFTDGIGHNLQKGDPDYANSDGPLESEASLEALAEKLGSKDNALNPDQLNPIDADSDQDGKLSAFERKVTLDYLVKSDDGFALFNRLGPITQKLNLAPQLNAFLKDKRASLN